jgi:pyruvate-ferredoxin/flavodoxin oxidoreductase
MRNRLEKLMRNAGIGCLTPEMKALFMEWIENREDAAKTEELAKQIIPLVSTLYL